MSKKILALILLAAMVLSMAACGGSPKAETTNQTEAANSTSEEQAAEEMGAESTNAGESAAPANEVALLGWKDEEPRSAIITFDPEHVQIYDEDSCVDWSVEFELIGDPDSVFELSCETATVQELYDETMDGYGGDGYSVTEMREDTLAGLPVWYFEVLYEGEPKDYYYILELGNGLCLYNGDSNGYDGDADFEEMMSHVFVKVEEGDGTVYRPSVGFSMERDYDEGILTVLFDSGEEFILDYAEDVVEMSPYDNGRRVGIYFQENEQINMKSFISDKFASVEEFIQWEVERGWWQPEGEAAVTQTSINGMDISLSYYDIEWERKGVFFIKMTDEFALRGRYEFRAESEDDEPVTMENVLAMVFGGEVQESEDAGTHTSAVDYDYTAPSALGDSLESMTYELDGVLYQFPTPVVEFLNNGWSIPNVFQGEIPAGDATKAALENSAGGVIYDVLIANPTEDAIALEDGIVMGMIIAQDSNVELNLPEGISMNSTLDDVEAVCDNSPAFNGSYSNYSWWSDDLDDGIIAWFNSSVELEYFEFTGLW